MKTHMAHLALRFRASMLVPFGLLRVWLYRWTPSVNLGTGSPSR